MNIHELLDRRDEEQLVLDRLLLELHDLSTQIDTSPEIGEALLFKQMEILKHYQRMQFTYVYLIAELVHRNLPAEELMKLVAAGRFPQGTVPKLSMN